MNITVESLFTMNEKKLNELLTQAGNASFDCGAYDIDSDGIEGYRRLLLKSKKAKQDVIDYVHQLTHERD